VSLNVGRSGKGMVQRLHVVTNALAIFVAHGFKARPDKYEA
ncbi:hypothetical protein ISN44_As11g033190, partial [Arabidopsis suecica]